MIGDLMSLDNLPGVSWNGASSSWSAAFHEPLLVKKLSLWRGEQPRLYQTVELILEIAALNLSVKANSLDNRAYVPEVP